MKAITYLTSTIFLIALAINLQAQTPVSISVTETNDAGEVAREGRIFTYAYSNWGNDCYAWGFNKTNTNLGCINGNDTPPWNCANSFTTSSSISGNTAYLNTSTTVRYMTTSGSYTNGNLSARLKFTATTTGGTPINFGQNGNIIFVPVSENFRIEVEIQLYGPGSAIWGTPANSGNYAYTWNSALNVFDALHTDPSYQIYTSYDNSETGFYTIPSSSTTPSITSPTCGSSTTSSSVTFVWTDPCTIHPESHYEWSLNGGAWTDNGTSNSTNVSLNIGQNTFQVRYYDGCNEQYYTSSTCQYYYTPVNSCNDIDHGGNNWTISSNTTVAGRHYNVGTFTVNSGVTATINSTCHYFYVEAENITMNGTIDGNKKGYSGGSGGAGGISANGGGGGIGGNGTGGGNNGTSGTSGDYGSCDDVWDYNRARGGAGGGGGAGAGSYGGTGGYGGTGETGWGSDDYGSWFGSLFGGDCNPDVGGGNSGNGGSNGSTYGSQTSEDINYGSGAGGGAGSGGNYITDEGQTAGDDGNNGYAGEAGGGAVKLIANETVTINGDIFCNGGDGGNGYELGNGYDEGVNTGWSENDVYAFDGGGTGGGGGASGGGVMIKGVNVTIGSSSDITANGGDGGDGGRDGTCGDYTYCYYGDGGAGGGGGRIKIFSCNAITNNGTQTVSGGTGGYGGGGGSTGRYYASSGNSGTIYTHIYGNPTANISSSVSTMCSGGTINLNGNPSGGAGSWQSHTWTGDISDLSNDNSQTPNFSTTNQGTYNLTYTVIDDNNCYDSDNITLQVVADPVVSTQPTGGTICAGQNHNMNVAITNGTGTTSYQWQAWNGSGWDNVGSNSSSISVSPGSNTNYQCIIYSAGEGCNDPTTNTATVIVNAPSITGITNGDFVWSGYTSTNWEISGNWLTYNGSEYGLASTIPTSSDNVFIKDYASCVDHPAATVINSNVSANDLVIFSALSLGNSSTLNVSGDFLNNGTFNSGTGRTNFDGSSPQTIKTNGDSFYDVSFNNTGSSTADLLLDDDMNISNSANFVDGIIFSMNFSVIFANGATTNSGTASSFVDAEIIRTGTTAFTYPTGDVPNISGSPRPVWAPIRTDACASSTINAQYFYENPPYDWWYHSNNMDPSIDHVTDREYWDLTTDNATPAVTLFWTDNTDDIHSFGTTSHTEMTSTFVANSLTIAHYNVVQNRWNDQGSSLPTTIYFDDGQLKTTVPFPNYSPITFASKRPDFQLPVELTRFEANCNDKNQTIDLVWETATETNNDYFTLERSLDGYNFTRIAKIPGNGSSNEPHSYSFVDYDPLDGINYYKLSQTDFDGSTETFNIQAETCTSDKDRPSVEAYPSIVEDNVSLIFEMWIEPEVRIELIDPLGKTVQNWQLNIPNANVHKVLDLPKLAPAMYLLRISTEKDSWSIKIQKQ